MSWGKKLLGAFVEIEEKPQELNPALPIKQQVGVTNPSTPAIKTFDTTVSSTAPTVVNNDLKAHILNLIKENNLPGPDYYEFTVMLEAMKAIPMVDIKYQSAFNALQAQGMTREQLISSAEQYKNLIKTDQSEFEREFAGMFKTAVEDKKAMIETKSKEMQALAAQIQALSDEIKTLNAEAADAESKLTIQKAQYINAGNAVVQEIDGELAQIQSYIK